MGIAAKVIGYAKAEEGYREGYSNGHYNNYQKFSPAVPGLEWSQNQAWCATFVSWAAMKGGAAELFPRTASCAIGTQWFKNAGRFSDYPAVGAQVFFGTNGGSHTGLVYAYDETYAYTVEGNTNDSGSAEGNGVYLKKRLRRDEYLHGYGLPKYPEGIVTADPALKGKAGYVYQVTATGPVPDPKPAPTPAPTPAPAKPAPAPSPALPAGMPAMLNSYNPIDTELPSGQWTRLAFGADRPNGPAVLHGAGYRHVTQVRLLLDRATTHPDTVVAGHFYLTDPDGSNGSAYLDEDYRGGGGHTFTCSADVPAGKHLRFEVYVSTPDGSPVRLLHRVASGPYWAL